MDLLIYLCSYTFFFLSFLCMLFLLRTSSCHFTSLYSLTLLITNQTSFRVPEISLKSKDKKETKQELEKRKNTLLDNDLGKQKEIQKANFYILNTQEILHWIRVRELLTGFTIYNGFTMACILQLLFTAIATNFKSVTIRIRFLSTISSSLFSSITPSKSLDIPQHYPRYKFIEFTITSQDIFIFFIYSKFWFCYFQYYFKKAV